jgi:hypothetical protein
MRRSQQHRGGTGERLDVVFNLPECRPHGFSSALFTAEVRKRRLERIVHFFKFSTCAGSRTSHSDDAADGEDVSHIGSHLASPS